MGRGSRSHRPRLYLLMLRVNSGTVVLARFGIVGQAVTFMLRIMGGTITLVSRLLWIMGTTLRVLAVLLAFTSVVGRGLTVDFNLMMAAMGRLLAFWWLQVVWIQRGTAATYRYIAAKFAATTALGMFSRAVLRTILGMALMGIGALISAGKFIFLGFAAIAAAVGLGAASVAGAPFLAIVLAIIIGVAALAAGIYLLVTNFSTVVGWIKSTISWLWGLKTVFLLLLGPIGWIILGLQGIFKLFKMIRDSAVGQWIQKNLLGIEDPMSAEDRAAADAQKKGDDDDRKAQEERDKRITAQREQSARDKALQDAREAVESARTPPRQRNSRPSSQAPRRTGPSGTDGSGRPRRPGRHLKKPNPARALPGTLAKRPGLSCRRWTMRTWAARLEGRAGSGAWAGAGTGRVQSLRCLNPNPELHSLRGLKPNALPRHGFTRNRNSP